MKKFKREVVISVVLAGMLFFYGACSKADKAVQLSDLEIDNIVRRSYQYVAMYNVYNKVTMKLDENDGIEIHVAAEKPEGVPEENWLPITRGDEDIDLSLRVYVPDLEKMKTWTPPKAEILK